MEGKRNRIKDAKRGIWDEEDLEAADLSGTVGNAVPGLGSGLFGGNREGDPDHRERGQPV